MNITNNKLENSALFDKYTINKDDKYPADIDFSGSIAMTQDDNHRGWLHILFVVAQKVHGFFFRRTS